MGFKKVLKKGVTSGLKPKQWIGYDHIKQDGITVGKIAKNVFQKEKKTERKETFEEAMKRFNLSEDDIQDRMKKSRQLVFTFLGISGLLFIYLIYQWSVGHTLSGFIVFILMGLTLAYAFREHFNLFQMRKRQLGCSHKEWFKSFFKGSK